MGMIKAIGTTRVTCGDCGKRTEYDVSSMVFKSKNSTATDAEEYMASAEIECSFCHSKIPYHLTARYILPDGPVKFSCSIIGATADPLDMTHLRPQES